MESADHERPGMAQTSFAMAVHKLQLSYHAHNWHEQIVDLATALEAALSGRHATDVVLRLRNRAAALLATERDPASAIFRDVGRLYSLRSTLVHGGEIKEKKLRKMVRRISTVPPDAPFGIALGHAVDRLRDLVRRALLARICLATGDAPFWPLGEDDGVDAALTDDDMRRTWRTAWHDTMDSIGAGDAADASSTAVDVLSRDDEPDRSHRDNAREHLNRP